MAGGQLEELNALVGAWTIEASHPSIDAVAHGESVFEWLEGEQFLLQRSRTDVADFPDSLIVYAADEDDLFMHYFDSRGVYRLYDVRFSEGVWTMSRDAPGFSQRFDGTFGDEGNTIDGLWKLSRDGETWDDDLRITFRRKP
ncbi:MAG TPA: hypothetical protein VFP31_05900 [Gaiellaceae bacterium]|nr:hypothetical protein [Gaiellaceae bacterium]